MAKPHNPRQIDDIQPGHFAIRLVRKGPWVAARIERTAYGWKAHINGQSQGFANPDPWIAEGVSRIWHFGRSITKAEYDALLGNKPATPELPVKLQNMRSIF